MKIVHVSSAHPWTDNRIHYREAASLADAGNDVTLVAVASDVAGPASKVRVVRIPRRARLPRVLLSGAQAVFIALRSRATVFHLHDPELVWAVPVLRAFGKKVIYDAHEDLPVQVVSKPYVSSFMRPLMVGGARLVVAVARLSTHIFAATDTVAARFPARKTTVIRNYPPLREEEASQISPERRPLRAVYIGAIGKTRGADALVAALSEGDFPTGWELVMAGILPAGEEARLKRLPDWSRVRYLGVLPPHEARDLLLDARVGLVTLQPTPAYVDALPTKMFEYFAAGVPVIASDFPLWRRIVMSHDCGILVDPDSPAQIAAALKRYADDTDLLRRHSANARRAAEGELNWRAEEVRMLRVYSALGV